MSWKSEVIADSSGTWTTNALRFATEEEARAYALDLALRWTLVRDIRATECDSDPTHTFAYGLLRAYAEER